MSLFINIIMLTLFILFMIFIFGGYHKNKSAAREAQREAQREAEEKKAQEKNSI